MKTTTLFTALVITTSLVSCSKDGGDTTKPEINLTSPAEGATLGTDGDVHFEMELSDDVALGSYKVEIHSNFDGHTHASVTRSDSDETTAFSYNNTWSDIEGQRNATIHHHEIIIPADATHGDYHFIVYCTDAAGNESYVVRNIEIEAEGEEHDHDEE